MHVWRTTLLDLVAHLTDELDRPEDVIAAAAFLIRSGSVHLCGTFAGCATPGTDGGRADAGWAFPLPPHS